MPFVGFAKARSYHSIEMTSFYFLLLFNLFSFIFFPIGYSDLAADRAALLALRSAVGGRSLLWNVSQSTPCSWVGVTCQQNRVFELRVPGMGLSGQLPTGAIGNLTELRTLSLRFNALSGPVPPDLGSCANLRNLYLQGNFFSGDVPESLFSLSNLIRLNLAQNNFSGKISSNFNKLTRLGTLYLNDNHLTGSIPKLNLNLQQFNVSNNQLDGTIPSKLSVFPANCFLGNSLCGGPLQPCPRKKLSGGAIAGIVIGSVLALILILAVLICFFRSKNGKKTESTNVAPVRNTQRELSGGGDSTSPVYPVGGAALMAGAATSKGSGEKRLVFFRNGNRTFDLEDLLRASAEVLGKGTFGTAYKASLDMETERVVVAVKRLKDVSVSEREFREKIEAAGGMDHENLVPLREYYYSKDEKLIVYDYMPMGSLSALLHGNRGSGRTPLNWEARSGIALGAARGIAYIHSRASASSHGNIKSSNILLTKSYEARVSDFGLAYLAGPAAAPTRVAGYRAPEVTDARKVSPKADVYSFGVLLLELLTGKAPTHAFLNEEGVDLPRWVQSVVREEWTAEVFDLELLRYQNIEEEMVQLLQLALDCAAQYPDSRPSMPEVVSRIEEICRSGLQYEQDPDHAIIHDVHSMESGAPVPSVVD